jgi:hypothetical protein
MSTGRTHGTAFDGLPAACIALTMGEPPLAARDEPFQQTFAFVECPPSIEQELAS